MKIFVKIPIGMCFFENFGKNRFTIDNRVFRVFVEIPIGKILALFYVFSATLEGVGVWVWTIGKMIEKSEIWTCQLLGKWVEKRKKKDFFPIDNMIISRKVENF